ncbi:MAG: methyltransferase domain-containing protein [Salinibacterium sp.]|nr:MAG: methyltransferase domain-containing protein [Salinibacterium sp.]
MRTIQGLGILAIVAFAYWAGSIDGRRAAFTPTIVVDPTTGTKSLKVGPVGVQTVSKRDGGSTGLYYDWAGLVHVFNPGATSVLMLGLGGGEMLRVLRARNPTIALTAVEIDDRVVSAALRNFQENVRDVTIVTADAARYMSQQCPGARFDAIIVDIFEGSELPEHFQSSAFFKDVERCLLPRGMVIMNARDRGLAREIAPAMHDAGFEDVMAFPVVGTPSVMLWAVRKDDWGEVDVPKELEPGFYATWSL